MTFVSAVIFTNDFETGNLFEAKPLNPSQKKNRAKLAREISDESRSTQIEGKKLGIVTSVLNEL